MKQQNNVRRMMTGWLEEILILGMRLGLRILRNVIVGGLQEFVVNCKKLLGIEIIGSEL